MAQFYMTIDTGVTDYTHTANKLNGSTGKIAKTYTHDDAGNIISDGGRTFVYNHNNRLIQVKSGESVIAEYAYDGFGRRVKKTVGSEITHYHYDLSSQLICETDGSGNAIRDYVYLNGEPVAMQLYGDDAGWYYFMNDHLGTPQKVVDGAGVVVWEAGYLPFGEARLLVADIDNNLRFPGQYFDRETRLHYNWNRYYDPESGRYWSVDPIGLEGGINLYAYVRNNPINFIDPNGLESLTACAVAIAPAIAMMDSPVIPFADVVAGSLIGIAYLIDNYPADSNTPLPEIDRTGKVHSHDRPLPKHVPNDWSREDMEQVRDDLINSIKVREREQRNLGEDGPHRRRIEEERNLLKQIQKNLSET